MKRNTSILIYFLTHVLFLGGGFARICKLCQKDTPIAFILGTLLGIIILYIITKLSQFTSKSIFYKLIYITYILFNLLIIFVILSNFLYSYFLPFTPSIISCLPFLLLATYLSSKKLKGIYNVAFITFFLSIFIILLKTTLISSGFDYANTLPILSVNQKSLFTSALIYAVISTSPILILINEKLEFKSSLKYYLIASITNIIVGITITLTLGETISVYSYPEYTVLRRISFFKFIENIENFICINWFFDLFISLSIYILKIKDTLNIKNNIIPFLISLSILYIVNKYFANNFYYTMYLYKYFPYICISFIIIILTYITITKFIRKIKVAN